MNKVKGAVIGLGKMGLSHSAIAGAHPDVEMVAVCDTSSIVLNAFKKFIGIKTYTDYLELFQNESLDFVFIATPTRYHYPMVKGALEKGLNVFCEKPFTLNSKKGEELVNLAREKRLINQVGYHNHFVGTFRELKRLVKEKIVGELIHFTGEAYGPVIVRENGNSWRLNAEQGGGCLYDYASHVINLIQEVIGHPVKASGIHLKKFYSKGVDDAVYGTLLLENGLSGILSVNWSDRTYRKMSTSLMVQGKKGKIICDSTELKVFLHDENKKEGLGKGWTVKYITDFALPVNFYLRGEEYSAQIQHFIDCIKNNHPVEYNSFEQGLYTDKVIEMIIENSKKHNGKNIIWR